MKSGIIYNGPSLLDGKPIVVIATFSNRNTKTGAVVQTYILRSDINPLEASKTGEDFSICGDCTMRGEVTTDPARKQAKGRRCYVNLGQGVLIVFKSLLARRVSTRGSGHHRARALCPSRHIRRPRSGARPRLGRITFRGGHVHSIQPPSRMASRYRDAKRRQSHAGGRALDRRGGARSE